MLGPLRAFTLDRNFAVHGVPCTVEVPGEDPVTTRAIWLVFAPDLFPGQDLDRREPVRALALRRDAVPRVPIGTQITAPENEGASDRVWHVDGRALTERDHVRVVVRPGECDE